MTYSDVPTSVILLVLALTSFRIQRFVTSDDWPPSERFRDFLADKAMKTSTKSNLNGEPTGFWAGTYKMFTCSYCFGTWTTFAVFAEFHYLNVVPFLVYAALAAAAIVGLLGNHDE